MLITSRSNKTVTDTAALHDKKYRDKARLFLLEGVKLFKEAVASGIELEAVFATEKNYRMCCEMLPEGKVIEVSDGVFEKISTEKSPQGIICTAKYIDKIHIINKIYNIDDFLSQKRRIMLLSSLRDPGNLGTVIRAASAFGIDELILSSDCADIYNPRTVRAAMGTLFRQKVTYVKDLAETVCAMEDAGYNVCSAVLDEGAVRLDEMKIDEKTAFVIGNEGHGIDPKVISASGTKVFIPMSEGVESLNASVAASVFMWQSAVALRDRK